jgi:hypothetical protein
MMGGRIFATTSGGALAASNYVHPGSKMQEAEYIIASDLQ